MEIDKIEKVHSIGHRLKDAKVTVARDFKFNVAGIKIEGTQGEVNNMPQWVGNILSDNNLATIDSPDMVTELKQALSKEKIVGQYDISTLDPHFYIKLKASMQTLNRDDFDRVESMMLELFRMRRGKLVKLADSSNLNSELYNKLTVEENIFFKTIYENSLEFEKQIKGDLNEQN
ncbi:MAG: DNA replication complex GINS family protein [Nitrosopumilus sp.]|nr:DNA replication complex GINS family protein [Nitrosopumilus sp.]MDC4230939.1 DNA replication complex GINS family protein [Nitrosopumilus sp.]